MSEPIRRAYSRAEMTDAILHYMNATYGPLRTDTADRDAWHERLGMLWDFIVRNWPEDGSMPKDAGEAAP